MVLIVKRLVPVFKASDKVPKKWRNLKKAVYVATFKYAYKTIPEILQREYGLKPDEKIVVFWMKSVPKPGWSYWRLPFRKVYSGRLTKMKEYIQAKSTYFTKRKSGILLLTKIPLHTDETGQSRLTESLL